MKIHTEIRGGKIIASSIEINIPFGSVEDYMAWQAAIAIPLAPADSTPQPAEKPKRKGNTKPKPKGGKRSPETIRKIKEGVAKARAEGRGRYATSSKKKPDPAKMERLEDDGMELDYDRIEELRRQQEDE